jgi:hypothetical protein
MKWGALKQNEAYSFPQNIDILGFLPILSVTVGPGRHTEEPLNEVIVDPWNDQLFIEFPFKRLSCISIPLLLFFKIFMPAWTYLCRTSNPSSNPTSNPTFVIATKKCP